MNSSTNRSAQKNSGELSFLKKQRLACNRACKHVEKWLIEKKINCYEIHFDIKIASLRKDYFRYIIWAVDSYHNRAHMFEMTYQRGQLKFSFINTSQNPDNLLPGDVTYKVSSFSTKKRHR